MSPDGLQGLGRTLRFLCCQMLSGSCLMLLIMQLTTEVMQLYSDDDEVEKAFSGENVKIKLKNVEEEVTDECQHLFNIILIVSRLLHVFYIVASNQFSCV